MTSSQAEFSLAEEQASTQTRTAMPAGRLSGRVVSARILARALKVCFRGMLDSWCPCEPLACLYGDPGAG